MRILIATDVTSRGGVDRYVEALFRLATADGHSVVVAVEETAASTMKTGLRDAGLPIWERRLYHRRHDQGTLVEDAAALLSSAQPDLVHIAAGVPWSCLPLREATHALGLPHAICEQFVPRDLVSIRAHAERIQRLYNGARAVIFVSEQNRAVMSRCVSLDTVRAVVIHNSVNNDALGRDAVGGEARALRLRARAAHGNVRLFSAGRFTRQKGFDVLLLACARLRDRRRRFTLALFGEGPEATLLADLVRDLDLAAIASLHPWTDELPQVAAEHDAFVLPSRAEGLSFILLEMMARGVPVIGSDVPSTAFALDGGRAGRLVPCGDPDMLADALEEVVMGDLAVVPLAEAARRRTLALFDERRQMAATMACWEP
jgi:glycosyltransferase involved in cell wall biosynthesis